MIYINICSNSELGLPVLSLDLVRQFRHQISKLRELGKGLLVLQITNGFVYATLVLECLESAFKFAPSTNDL